MTRLLRSSKFWLPKRLLLMCVALSVVGVSLAQTGRSGADDEPLFQEYRGVKLGSLADEVRKKLGNPRDKGDDQDFYVFSDNETCQIMYDKATRQVTAISVDFLNGAREVITPQQVFGSDVEAKPDGSKHKLVRYPKAGFWVSYSRTAGDTPIITVTIQKIPGQ